MNPSETSPGDVAASLALAAKAQPEAPFLFYRNAKGHFRWLPFSGVAGLLEAGGSGDERLSVQGVVVEREAVELLGGFLRAAIAGDADSANLLDLPRPAPGARRDIWISWRPLSDPDELALARWAIVTGAAILLEPGTALHPELFAWVRPTLVSGSIEELCTLAGQLESLAPRFLRRRWLRQRARRLRLMLVTGPAGADDPARVAARWRDVSPLFAPAVASFSGATLV